MDERVQLNIMVLARLQVRAGVPPELRDEIVRQWREEAYIDFTDHDGIRHEIRAADVNAISTMPAEYVKRARERHEQEQAQIQATVARAFGKQEAMQ